MASAVMTLLVWNSKQSHAALLTLGPVRLHSAWSVTAARSAIRANGFDRRLGRGTASQYEIVAVLRGESMINQAPAGRPVSIARKRSPGTDTQQSYMRWVPRSARWANGRGSARNDHRRRADRPTDRSAW
jgi:hypothetical protein